MTHTIQSLKANAPVIAGVAIFTIFSIVLTYGLAVRDVYAVVGGALILAGFTGYALAVFFKEVFKK